MKQLAILTVLLPLNMAVAEPAKPVELISGDVLTHFREVGKWGCVGAVKAVPDQTKFECSGEGAILTNVPTKKSKRARYLFTRDENQEVTGPTRAHPLKDEVAKGPIAIQGDHGPIAIRGFTVKAVELK